MNLYYPISKLTTVPSYFDQIGLDPSLGYSTKNDNYVETRNILENLDFMLPHTGYRRLF